jgi:phosphoribosyl-ATP pyrophosphohydrolase
MIIPSIDIMDGRAVQLKRGRDVVLDGGDPLERLRELAVVGEVAVVDLDAALGRGSNDELVRRMVRLAPCRVGGGIRTPEAARDWLDAGAEKVVLGTAARRDICAALPRERVVAAVDSFREKVVVDGWRSSTGEDPVTKIVSLRDVVGGFLLTQVEHEGCEAGFVLDLVERAVAAAGDARLTAAGGITTPGEIATLDRLGADAQVGMALYSGRLSLGDAFAATLDKGIDGLWPTVVCDELGATLGLVWSSRESLAAAVDARRGIYWSRSRGELWPKGETSGNTQELLRVDLDCDRDAVRVTVRQRGGFCHTGERGCWPSRFRLGDLERLVHSRLASAPPGSGTAKLLADPELLAAKLREEAAELAAAGNPEAAVQEASDLLFFTLVAAGRAGAHLVDIERELALRRLRLARRPMTAKPDEADS